MPRRTFRPRLVPTLPRDEIQYAPHHYHSDCESDEYASNSEEAITHTDAKQPRIEQGMKGEVKFLYEGKRKCSCCPRWVDKVPRDTIKSIKASKEVQQYAVIARYKRNTTNEKGDLQIDSILVQSPLLQPVLDEVFKDFPGVTGGLERLKFTAPFIPFFHRWQEYQVARWECRGETRIHADLLYDVLHKQIKEDKKKSAELTTRGLTTFDHIWTLFTPGELIACKIGDQDLMCTISTAEYFRDQSSLFISGYVITARYIDIGRNGPGLAVLVLALPIFTGTMPISELVFEDMRKESKDYPAVFVMPADMRPDLVSLKARLIERGRKFESLQGHHFKEYDGDMEEIIEIRRRVDLFKSVKRKVTSRIVVDAEALESNMPACMTNLLPLDADLTPQGEERLDQHLRLDVRDYSPVRTAQERIEDRFKSTKPKASAKLTDEQLLICSPKVKGYSLKSKAWAEFYVDNIRDVTFHDKAFSQVVIPENYKTLLSSFLARHLSDNDTFDDIVPGKGKGLIVLLSGEPGVGKTLTAETMAEELHAPLYSLGAGDLGTFADEIENRLTEVLDLCSRWKAVLLLDEADVFLEKRWSGDREKNRIVSVFLRLLEYHDGLLFMTTNRVSCFDPAFRSRIQVNMNYPPLDKEARTTIWTNFLKTKKQGEVAITREQIDSLADRSLNGREIKNSIKIAGLLAGQKGEVLGHGHLETVLDINGYGQDTGEDEYVLENEFRVS